MTNQKKVLIETPYGVYPVTACMAKIYARGRNAEAVRNRRSGLLVRVILRPDYQGDESILPGKQGNAQKHVHDHENNTNPPRTWEYKRHLLRAGLVELAIS
jgi:hypothetical protein